MSEYSNSTVDLLSLDQGYEAAHITPLFNSYFLYSTPNENVVRFEIALHNLSLGLNQVIGSTASGLGRLAASSMDDSIPGELVIPAKVNSGTVYQQTESVCHANVFSTLAIGAGSTANHCLLKETSATDPTLVEITYTPGSKILCLVPTTGLGSTAEKLLVGRAGAAIHVLSDLTTGGPTVYGTMHANTTNAWGIINTPINSASVGTGGLLIGANSNIYFLSKGAAVGDAPTVASTGIRNGGYAIGIITLPSIGVARAFWWIPDTDNGTVSGVAVGGQVKGHIFHTNLEGSDWEPLETSFLNGMLFASRVNGTSMILTDGLRTSLITDKEYDTGQNSQAQYNAMIEGALYYSGQNPFQPTVGGFWIANGSVIALSITSTGNGYMQKLNLKTHLWNNLSAAHASNVTVSTGAAPFANTFFAFPLGGSLPFSSKTSYAHVLPLSSGGSKKSYWRVIQNDGVGIYWIGTTVTEASALAYTCAISLESNVRHAGIEGSPFVVEEIVYMGNDTRTANNQTSPPTGSVKYVIGQEIAGVGAWTFAGGVSRTFNLNDQASVQSQRFGSNASGVRRLAIQITSTAATAGAVTPNATPFIIRGLIFRDHNVVTPASLGAGVAWYTY